MELWCGTLVYQARLTLKYYKHKTDTNIRNVCNINNIIYNIILYNFFNSLGGESSR